MGAGDERFRHTVGATVPNVHDTHSALECVLQMSGLYVHARALKEKGIMPNDSQ